MPPLPVNPSTGLTITNPLILYRSLLATKQIDPDPSQHRLALHLQKLYNRLKDYSPQEEYGSRLKAISHAIGEEKSREDIGSNVAVPGHPLRRNPLFAHLFSRKEDRDTKALTRVLTNHEAAMELDSPKGLLLHGEVGTGKSMLLDLLADSLPNKMKARWHFNTFMLETISKLEALRHSRASIENEAEYSLLWLAKDMIEKSPILFLDEFQLPDRAASKILSNLFTTFFQLGGVLVASSNRMPEELAKASGVEFVVPPKVGLVRNIFGIGAVKREKGVLADPGKGEFAAFLDVLKARCEVWEMEGGKDWRRREVEASGDVKEVEAMREDIIEGFSGLEKLAPGNLGLGFEQSLHELPEEEARPAEARAISPMKYLLTSMDTEETWNAIVHKALPESTPTPVPWRSMALIVYGRTVNVPQELSGVALWNFSDLCGGTFGPADYITMASTFHTIILDRVPVLTILQKNEARRLITLLDALYEARCKLIIRADAGPDDIFFPETKKAATTETKDENDGGDAVYPETLSEIYQDQTSPFRPNISSYEGQERTKTGYDPDEDSDFGPVPSNGHEVGRSVNFGMTSAFIGEDERFAYKRARSRLWEMCGARWHARSEEGWWKPLPLEVRRWERSRGSKQMHPISGVEMQGDVKMGPAFELDRPAGLQGKELEAKAAGLLDGKENPWVKEKEAERKEPKMGWTPWGMVSWARRSSK